MTIVNAHLSNSGKYTYPLSVPLEDIGEPMLLFCQEL